MVGGDEVFEAGVGDDGVGGHDALDGVPDLGERRAAFDERSNSDFVGGIQDGGQGAAGVAGVAGEVEGREVLGAWGFEGQAGELGEVERGEVVRDAVRVGDSVLNGEAHVAVAELGEDTAVFKLDHAMYDALGVDDDFDLGHGDVEQPFGLDHFQAFVEESGGVDGDLATHFPRGVFECLSKGDEWELFCRQSAEGAAAGGEQETAEGISVPAFEALEDGVVLAIHREETHAFGFGSGGDGFARHDEDFFTGDGEVHATVNGGEGGGETGGADDGDEDEICFDSLHQIDQALGTRVNADI